jgi:2'-deoxynucleoside 5'-phosphate N-hydrolase
MAAAMHLGAMRAYIGIKFHPDDRNRDTIEMVSKALELSGFETTWIRRDVEKWGSVTLPPSELMTKTFEVIRACQFVVIDLTEKGVGLGIEAGYAYAQDIPIITIAREGSDISDTLRGISKTVRFYTTFTDLCTNFGELKHSS